MALITRLMMLSRLHFPVLYKLPGQCFCACAIN